MMPLKYVTRSPAAYFSEILNGVAPSVVLPASILVRKEMICPPSVAEMPVMALLGGATGITVSYFLGRIYGLKLIHRYGRYFHLTEERFWKLHNWFERAGRWSLFFGYYIAGVRHLTAMVAGASALEYSVFAGFAYCGAFTWVLTFLSLGYFVGNRWQGASERIHHYILVGCVVLGAILGIYLLTRYLWKRS